MPINITPISIDATVKAFAQEISPGAVPIYIRIRPEPGCEPLDCYHSVRRKVTEMGGRIQYGWAVWEWPKVFIEAEAHAVYDPGDGAPWMDITPGQNPDHKRRLFIPDDSATYDFESEGVRRDNIRKAIAKDKLVDEFLLAAGERAKVYDSIPGIGRVTPDAATRQKLENVERHCAGLMLQLAEKYLGPNEPCLCGSGKKFRKCHGTF